MVIAATLINMYKTLDEAIVSIVRNTTPDPWPYRVWLQTDREYWSSGEHVGAANLAEAEYEYRRMIRRWSAEKYKAEAEAAYEVANGIV